MPTFRYQGRDQQGQEVKGDLRADSQEAVVIYLSRRNITPVNIKLISDDGGFSWEKFNNIEIRFGGITNLEMSSFCRNMATMLDAGVPILKSLQQLAKSMRIPQFKKALFEIIDSIQDGAGLAASMRKYPDIFSLLCVSTIEIGENTGNLAESFLKFADYLEMEDKNSKQLKSALRYPKMVIIAIIIAMTVINIVVVPSFKNLFQSMRAELPWATKVLMGTSDFITNYWYLLIIMIACFIMLMKWILKNEEVRMIWDRFKLSTPIIGPLLEKIILTRITWSLALIIRSGVPILKCIDLVSQSIDNVYLRQKMDKIKTNIENGKTLSDAVQDVNLFNYITMQMLMISEESGRLDDILVKIASEYDKETEYELKQLGDAIEPIMLVILGAMVAVLALGIFLPMWDMGKHAIK